MSPTVRTVVARPFDVSAENIFDAWLDPAWIGCWMVGLDGRDERIVRLGVEPRAGGRFSFVISGQNVETEYCGKYLELERPALLVFTWNTSGIRPASSRVIVEIAEHDHGSELTLTHVMSASDAASSDPNAGFWRQKLDALAHAFVATKTLTLDPS